MKCEYVFTWIVLYNLRWKNSYSLAGNYYNNKVITLIMKIADCNIFYLLFRTTSTLGQSVSDTSIVINFTNENKVDDDEES